MVAIAAGAAIASTAAGAIGSSMQAGATTSAANSAISAQQQQLANAQGNEQPFLNAGTGAVTQEQNLLGLNGPDAATAAMSQFTASPGYQYQLQQGLSAVDNAAAAGGEFRSGNTQRAEQTLGNNLAGADFGAYYARLNNLVGTGSTAANALTGADLQTGQGIASTDTSEGNQLANIYGNEASGTTNALNSGLKNYAYGNILNSLTGSGAGGAFDGGGAAGSLNNLAVTPGGFGSGVVA